MERYICIECHETLHGEPIICDGCGSKLCDDCCFGPDPDEHGEEKAQENYCLYCYAGAGYVDVWTILYRTTQGDIAFCTVDVPKGTHPFEVKAMAGELIGGMYEHYISARKVDLASWH